jgi:hypothetical protein
MAEEQQWKELPDPAEATEAEVAATEEEPEELQLSDEEMNRMIESICNDKADEFRQLGYEQVTGAEIWQCVESQYKKGYPALHRLVGDILSLRPQAFMNWLMKNAYKG